MSIGDWAHKTSLGLVATDGVLGPFLPLRHGWYLTLRLGDASSGNQTNPGDEKCPTCRRDILVPVIWQVVGMRYSGVSHPTDSAGIRKTQTSSSGGFKISCTSSIVVCLAHKLLKSEYTRDAQETANRPFEIPLVADNTDQQFFVPLLVLLPPLLRRCRNRLRRTH